MPASACYRPVHIKPVTGYLDVRSNPDEVPFGGYRWVQNFEVTQKFKLCRARGFRKMQDGPDFNNEDLHDQLKSYVRQPIQFLFEAETPAGFSKFFAGTQNRLYAKSNSTGNWKVISDELGGTPVVGCSDKVRWTAGYVGQTVVLSNAVDRPVSHIIDQPEVDNGQSVELIRDLETIHVTQVGIVYSWRDFIICFNVVQDGARFSDRVLWSDYQQPISFLEDVGVSLAGTKDLGAGETIIGVAPLRDSLMIYTTRGIWEMRVTGGDGVFSFGKRYSPDKVGARCLAYPNTLVSDGDANYYFGLDGIYAYDMSLWVPKLVDWIHRASSLIFDDIDKGHCNVHHGAYHSERRQIWWSWAREGENCPTQSLVVNIEFPFSSYVDHGFSAFSNHLPDHNKSIRDFLIERCICTSAELSFSDKEGGYCTARVDPTCDITPANFYSGTARIEDGITVEDWAGDPDPDSLYAILGDATVQDLCGDEYSSDACNANKIFVMASSVDYALKEVADVYYRERCTSTQGCGTYVKEGYRSILRSGPIDLKIPDDDKSVSRFAVECYPAPQTIPSQIKLRIGVSGQALDSNDANQGTRVILWEDQDIKDLVYQGDATEAQHRKDNTRPDVEMEWGLYLSTRFIYFELELVNSKVTPQDTGGACCFSRFTFDAKAEPRC